MTDSPKKRLNPLALLLNTAAIGLILFVLTMDGSVFMFWLRIGVFDGHWNDVSLQILFVCIVVSFLCFLGVAMLFGLGIQLTKSPADGKAINLGELGNLIDSGWERSIRTSTTCSTIVLSLLVVFCAAFWNDLVWWTELCRGDRAAKDLRMNDAMDLYNSALKKATNDRQPLSSIFLANQYNDAKKFAQAEIYYNQAIAEAKVLPGDNRALRVWACQGLARVLMNEGKAPQAESVLREGIATFGTSKELPMVQVRLIGNLRVPSMSPPPTLIGTYTLLELACVKQNQFERAEDAFEENLNVFRDLPTPNWKAVIGISELYAGMLIKTPEAHKYIAQGYKAALDLISEKFGANSEEVGKVETSYADALRSIGDIAEAEKNYSLALTHLKTQAKDGDAVLLRVMNNLASIFVKDGRMDEAEKLYKDEIDLVKSWKTPSSDVQIQIDACRAEYSNLLQKLNRVDEAKKLQSSASVAPTR